LKHDWDSVKYLLNKKQTCTFFEDIQGYDLLKRRLYMGVIYPMLRPEKKKTINCQNLSRNNCLLLHGPSGTGKTQLANAIATELREKAIFLHIKSSDILGKYLGESEKNIKNIFLMAEEMTQFAKVILFFDEGENIFASREGGNKYTTAVTSELLSFMSEQPELMVIVSTNLPWRLEEAFRRRFTDKIMVDLPSKHDLAVMLKFQLREFFIIMTDEEYADVASQMTDFTGGDVALLCDQIKASMNQDINGADFFRPCPYRKDGTLVPCDKDDFGAQEINLSDLHHHIIDHQGYKKKDVLQVLSSVQRSTSDSQVMHHRIYAKDNSYHPSNEGSSEDSARWRKMQETILNKNKEVIDNGLSEIAKKFDKK
jgi:vacuolar protein-sorting-associated protein 4